MTLEELHRTVVEGFDRIEDRLAQNDARWAQNDARWAHHEVRLRDLDARITEEGATTRRYFDVMVEKVETAVRIVAEGHVHLQTIVDNHEARLQSVEKHR